MSTFFGAEDLNDFLAWTLESWQIETCRVQPFVPVVVNQIWPIAIELYDRALCHTHSRNRRESLSAVADGDVPNRNGRIYITFYFQKMHKDCACV